MMSSLITTDLIRVLMILLHCKNYNHSLILDLLHMSIVKKPQNLPSFPDLHAPGCGSAVDKRL